MTPFDRGARDAFRLIETDAEAAAVQWAGERLSRLELPDEEVQYLQGALAAFRGEAHPS